MEAHQGMAKPDWQVSPLHPHRWFLKHARRLSFAWQGFGLVERVNHGFPRCRSRGLPFFPTQPKHPSLWARRWNPFSGGRLKLRVKAKGCIGTVILEADFPPSLYTLLFEKKKNSFNYKEMTPLAPSDSNTPSTYVFLPLHRGSSAPLHSDWECGVYHFLTWCGREQKSFSSSNVFTEFFFFFFLRSPWLTIFWSMKQIKNNSRVWPYLG